MSDIEKTPAQVSEPPAAAEPGSSTKISKVMGYIKGTTTNDLNVLGRDILRKALEHDEAQLERDSIKVRRKLDFIVLPMVCALACTDLYGRRPLIIRGSR